jgi:hypothetical protein
VSSGADRHNNYGNPLHRISRRSRRAGPRRRLRCDLPAARGHFGRADRTEPPRVGGVGVVAG